MLQSPTISVDTVKRDGERAGNYRGWVTFSGLALIVLGAAAVVHNVAATLVSVLLLGWLLTLAGAVQIVHAWQVRSSNAAFLYMLDGIIRVTVGTLLVVFPESGALTLTLLLSVFFIVGGLFKAVASSTLRLPGWEWIVASGLLSAALGVLVALQWPTSGLWFIGLAVGIDMVLYGWALLMFAAVVRKMSTSLP